MGKSLAFSHNIFYWDSNFAILIEFSVFLSFPRVTITNCKLSRICVVEFWVHEEILSIRGVPYDYNQFQKMHGPRKQLFTTTFLEFVFLNLLIISNFWNYWQLTKCMFFNCINFASFGYLVFGGFPATFSDFSLGFSKSWGTRRSMNLRD